jgi:hypothetical protein
MSGFQLPVTSLPVHDATAISGGPEIWNLKEVKD